MKQRLRKYSTSLPEHLLRKVKQEAERIRVPHNQLISSALEDFFDPHGAEREKHLISHRLARLEARQKGLNSKIEILSETLALFIQVWFANTYEVPEAEKESASLLGERRYNRFLEALGRRLQEER